MHYKVLKSDYCVCPLTKILKADLTWAEAQDLKVDDELIGFDENINQGHRGTKYKPTKVLNKKRVSLNAYKVITDRGEITASEEHLFITRKRKSVGGGPTRIWTKTKDLKIGDTLAFSIEPWEVEDSYDAGYIAGFLDGEGWCSGRHCGFGQLADSPVLSKFISLLEERNFEIGGNRNPPQITQYKPVAKLQIANMWDSLRLLGSTRPVRLLKNSRKLWEGARTWGKLSRNAIVKQILPLGTIYLTALETSSKTLITNGFLSHNSQLEFRVCLWAAGYDPNLADGAFEMLVERSEGQFEKAAVALQWKPRDVAKSMVHGGDYMEGLQIKTAKELSTPNALGDRREGALLVYDGRDLPEWRFRDGYVCFTGVNIAERLFGHKTREARARALKLQKVYLDAFPGIREFQQRVSKEIEFTNEVRLPSGHRVPLYGRTPEEDLKYAAALWGQGCGAIYIDEAMIRLDGLGRIANLQVHDELMFNDIPLEWKDETCLEYMHPMIQMSSILKGFSCPAAVKVGPSWGDTKEIGVIRWIS